MSTAAAVGGSLRGRNSSAANIPVVTKPKAASTSPTLGCRSIVPNATNNAKPAAPSRHHTSSGLATKRSVCMACALAMPNVARIESKAFTTGVGNPINTSSATPFTAPASANVPTRSASENAPDEAA